MSTDTPPTDRFDVIIVGAGPAGLAAAKTTASAGLQTLVLERGSAPGVKNVMGGVIYVQPTEAVFPEFHLRAPLERCVVQQDAWILTPDSAIKVGYRSNAFQSESPNAYTCFRVRLDKYFAEQARQAGALIVNETMVDEVLRERGQVIGVRAGRAEGEVYAPVVILAEGVNCELALALGMQTPLRNEDVASAVKEVIHLDKGVIADRFNLQGDEGATIECFADATMGTLGTGFIYTNKETLSVGVGGLLSAWAPLKLTPHDFLQRFKQHPMIAPLLAGGETVEYMSHMIPEGGFRRLPQLAGNGIMIVGDAAMLVNGLHREGANHALRSGQLAGETAILAHQRGDFTMQTLQDYTRRLWDDVTTLRDLKKYRNASRFVEHNPHVLQLYPQWASDAAREMLTVNETPKRRKQWRIIGDLIRRRGVFGLIRDAVTGGRSMW